MKLSAPVYRLKRNAKRLSRKAEIPLNEALNRIAREEGFSSWSLLAARLSDTTPARDVFQHLSPGDLVLLAARPGHGKTLLGLELVLQAIRSGGKGVFFTLEYNAGDVVSALKTIGADVSQLGDSFEFDDSDCIDAGYIIERLQGAPSRTVAVIDYLQILDQKRSSPELMTQISALRDFAARTGVIIALISQIDRSFELSAKSCPALGDVRLPNPLDLKLFSKACFLHNGEVQIEPVT